MDEVNWKEIVKKYTRPQPLKSWWQLTNTLVPLFVLWFLAYKSLNISYWLTLFFCFFAQFFFMRTFIIMHDCGHGTFFSSKRLRTLTGYITGILTFTPYWQWTRDHAAHHSTSGNLDKRGMGDVWTVTAKEYQQMGHWDRCRYHIYRSPFVVLFIGAIYLFQIRFRFFSAHDGAREKRSVIITNIALLAIIGAISYGIGFKNFLLVHAPILIFYQFIGIWLFYVQHQYESAYWRRQGDWDYFSAATMGSSYFKLPKILQWFSGNIGLHHIHHLSHQIPNYNLEKCMKENEIFQHPHVITLLSSVKCFALKIYDEEEKKMITMKEYREKYGEDFMPMKYVLRFFLRA